MSPQAETLLNQALTSTRAILCGAPVLVVAAKKRATSRW
jgi:hypothetical protein